MGLRELKLQTSTIEVPGGGEFTVRGLSFKDIATLAVVHGATMTMLYQEYIAKAAEGLDPAKLGVFLATVQQAAPELVAHTIAIASDEGDDPDMIALATRLPMPAQIEAVEQVMVLTFTSEAVLKKAIETVIRGMTGATSTVNGLTKPSR